jgi:hypothetical protein
MMVRENSAVRGSLGLRSGEIVEVRSASEILATLDTGGMVDGLPFMPEMLQYCGKRFRVYKRADKTCDTIGTSPTHSRRMVHAVHLEGLRCDGASHGGCQAQCLLFWKEAWLRRPSSGQASTGASRVDSARGASIAARDEDLRSLESATRRSAPPDHGDDVPSYVCQATELVRATRELPWWDVRQYTRELLSGNVTLWTFLRTFAIAAFNAIQRRRGGRQYPDVAAQCNGDTPSGTLDLKPGELVQIRTKEEIFATLNQRGRNRGLFFDVEMVPFCGRTAVVKHRVEQIIDEKTGKMLHMSHPCIILEGVACGGCLSRERLLCPRSIYSYWREIWLQRVPVASSTEVPAGDAIPSMPAAPSREPVRAAAVGDVG